MQTDGESNKMLNKFLNCCKSAAKRNIKSLEKDDSNKQRMQGLIKTAQEIVQGVKNDKESTLPPVW